MSKSKFNGNVTNMLPSDKSKGKNKSSESDAPGGQTNIDALSRKSNSQGESDFGNATNIDFSRNTQPKETPTAEQGELRRIRRRTRVVKDRKADLRLVAVVLAVFFLGFVLITRYLVDINKPKQGTFQANQSEGLYYSLRIENRPYSKGEPIGLQLSIRNNSGHRQSIEFQEGYKFDFIVQKQINLFFIKVPLEIWRYSKANREPITDESKYITIMPNEEKIFRAEWNQTDNKGDLVPDDNYVITGYANMAGETRSLQLEQTY